MFELCGVTIRNYTYKRKTYMCMPKGDTITCQYKFYRQLAGNIVTLKPFSIEYIYISSCNGIPYKVIICQASCRKVRGFPTKIVVNLIENRFEVKRERVVVVGSFSDVNDAHI